MVSRVWFIPAKFDEVHIITMHLVRQLLSLLLPIHIVEKRCFNRSVYIIVSSQTKTEKNCVLVMYFIVDLEINNSDTCFFISKKTLLFDCEDSFIFTKRSVVIDAWIRRKMCLYIQKQFYIFNNVQYYSFIFLIIGSTKLNRWWCLNCIGNIIRCWMRINS